MLSKNLTATLQRALNIAKRYNHQYATYEHLLLALLEDTDAKKIFKNKKIDIETLSHKLVNYLENNLKELATNKDGQPKPTVGFQRIIQRAAIYSEANNENNKVNGLHVLAEFFFEYESFAVNCLKIINLSRQDILYFLTRNQPDINNQVNFAFDRSITENRENRQNQSNGSELNKNNPKPQNEQQVSALETHCVNLNVNAQKGGIDCLIGRQNEIQRTIEILSRRRKNNALLVGEPGVGKTAIAEGLALRIVNGDVPKILQNSTIYMLDIGSLVSGTKYRGDFEDRMKKIISEIKARTDAILFIDEIHTIIGAGSTATGSLDASNLLKPAFAKGEIRCIGSTTFKEYHNHFEKDMALVRRFQRVVVAEPDEATTIEILKGLKGYYEQHHKVKYHDSTLSAAVTLSQRYINDRHLPDKAIDLIDEAGARRSIANSNSMNAKLPVVTTKDIEMLVASIANIPNINIALDDVKKLQQLENNLKNNVFGQDEAAAKLCASIKLSRAGLKKGFSPTGCYLFAGETGVGKTELAKQLAKYCGMELIKFDMSEYSESHSISRLIGSPPGYIGFDQGGLLTEEVDKYPYSVVLLDEIEKAHADIYNLLLQVMDEGKLTDSTGKSVNFMHTIVILTTNLGSQENSKNSIGFGNQDNRKFNTHKEAVSRVFSEEFISRLDSVIVFNPLSEQVIDLIIDKDIEELKSKLSDKKVQIEIDKTVKDYIAKVCSAEGKGARTLHRVINTELKQKIADEILFGKLRKGGRVEIKYQVAQDNLIFNFTNHNKVKEIDKSELVEN